MTEDIEIPEFDGDDNINVSLNGKDGWINKSSKPLKSIECVISLSIINRIRDIEYCVNNKLGGSNEFGGYVKWHWDNGKVIIDDFMIPKQLVGGATVDFKSDAAPGYTGVFHKHPDGCTRFSGVDDTYINSNHDISILFEGGTFVYGIINIDLPGNMRYQTPMKIIILEDVIRNNVDVSMISNVSVISNDCNKNKCLFLRDGSLFQESVRIPPKSLSNFEKCMQEFKIPEMEDVEVDIFNEND